MMDPASSSSVKVEMTYHRPGFANYVGTNFLAGSAIGAAVHSVLGYRSGPAGGRLAGAACAALRKAPAAGGFLGALSALTYVFEGGMAGARGGRHDRWNTAAATGAALCLLHVPYLGTRAAASVLLGAALGGMCSAVTTTILTENQDPFCSIFH